MIVWKSESRDNKGEKTGEPPGFWVFVHGWHRSDRCIYKVTDENNLPLVILMSSKLATIYQNQFNYLQPFALRNLTRFIRVSFWN